MTSLTREQRRALVLLLILVALLAGVIGVAIGYHYVTVGSLVYTGIVSLGTQVNRTAAALMPALSKGGRA